MSESRSRGVRAMPLVLIACLGGSVVAAPHPFLRGDAETNGDINITDGIRILNFLFRGDPSTLPCFDAADANDSGDLTLTDGIFLFVFLFRGGLPPRAPYPECDLDLTPDELDCQAFRGCPVFEIAIGDTVSENAPASGAGRVEKPGALDFFVFEAEPGALVFFDELTTSCCDLFWRLVDANGRVVFFDFFGGPVVGRRVLESGGTYAIRVENRARDASDGSYSFRLREIPDGGQFEIAIGDTVSPGVPAPGAGVLEEPGVIDLYVFDASAGQEVYVREPEGTCCPFRWELFDPEGNRLLSDLLNGLSPASLVLESAGRHTIAVDSPFHHAGEFTFELLEAD